MELRQPFQRLYQSSTIPFALLLMALGSLFVFQNDLHSFPSGHHGSLSSHGMTISRHLSPEHGFLMFNRMIRTEDGSIQYDLYNRFPIGSFALIRLFILPFEGNLSMQISAARMLMLGFFIAAAIFAYFSGLRLTGNRWVAVGATLLAFSSYYCLYYDDMIFNDVPTLFGLLLTFNGLAVFVQEGRFAQLLVKTAAGLLLGWQVLALLLPFTLFGCVRELYLSCSIRSVLKSRYFVLGLFALLCGAAILAVNLTGEYLALDVPLTKLPSFGSILWRFGQGPPETYESYAKYLRWKHFMDEQANRAGRMCIPHILAPQGVIHRQFRWLGWLALLTGLAGAFFSRHKILIVSLVLSGLFWAFPMKYFVVFHDFQSIFFIGIPLVFFSMLAHFVERFSKPVLVGFAGAAFLIFISSQIHLNDKKEADTGTNVLTADFQRIADRVGKGKTIFVEGDYFTIGGATHAVGFYLAGNYFSTTPKNADFILSEQKNREFELLTPENTRVFLYKP
ncbi:MAG TPA: hypothetical protein VNL73_10070 [Verrucomicrobiae bacterium]|nr:hypothetical protein [Verrucomicrobiae bacterium]